MGIAASLAVGDKWWWETQAFTLRRLTGELTAITRKGISLSLMSMGTLSPNTSKVSQHERAELRNGLPVAGRAREACP